MKQREIKFRAWDKEEKIMSQSFGFLDLQGWDDGSVFTNMGRDLNSKEDLDKIILMQFTGLHDKNGKEIYEGDIVKSIEGNLEIEFRQGVFGVEVEREENMGENGSEFFPYFIPIICDGNPDDIFIDYKKDGDGMKIIIEVIGNIYSNPELLK